MVSQYPDDWKSLRLKVFKRDGYRCQNCNATGGPSGSAELHAHHIVPKSKGGTNQATNLKTLCSDCHNAIHHRNKIAPTAQGLETEDRYADLIQLGIVFVVFSALLVGVLKILFWIFGV